MALRGIVVLCMLGILTFQFLTLLGASQIPKLFGVLLSALAVQFIFDGVRESGLLP